MNKEPVPVYVHRFAFPPEAEDPNHHVNNVEYVRMLQESAIAHTRQNGWAPDELHERGWTWVANFKKIRSLRKYRFVRAADGAVLAEARTDWVFLDFRRNRPMAIPPEVLAAYVVVPEQEERNIQYPTPNIQPIK